MMKRSILFVAMSAVAVGALGGAARVAVSGGQSGALVRLQPAHPGVVQSGNINVDGVIRGGFVSLESAGTNIRSVSTASNSIVARSNSANAPTIVGIATQPGNWGVWGANWATAAGGALGVGANGLYAYAGTGGLAGEFYGNVLVDPGNITLSNGNLIANGRIGVNTTSPVAPVSIQNASNYDFLALGNAGATKWLVSSYPDLNSLDIAENNVAWARMHFSPGGRVGINNATPQHALDVKGGGITTDSYLRVFSTGFGMFQEASGRGIGTYLDADSVWFGSWSNNNLHFFTNYTWHATLTADGKFGLGVGPTAKLDVAASGGLTAIAASGDGIDGVFATTALQQGNGLSAEANNGASAIGVWGRSTSGYGVVGSGPVYGVFALGDLGAAGTKTFRIDHPQDPLNKYLLHYSAEGPEPQNIYNGTITTDSMGYAVVELPSYYDSINRDARIQISVVDESDSDAFVQAKIVQKVKGGQFKIRTSAPNVEVFWEVKAVRNDAFVQKHGAPVEVNKNEFEKGTYQHPDLYDASPEMGMKYRAPAELKPVNRKELPALPPRK